MKDIISSDPIENNILFNTNIDKDEINNTASKQDIFDKFLTYRRRMARLSATQALYLYDFRCRTQNIGVVNIFSTIKTTDTMELCQDVIDFYKNIFFQQQEYGWTRKNKKIDEIFMFEIVNTAVNSIEEIDNFIQSHLSKNWTTDKLDYVLRAIIRCAVAEILLGENIEKAVLCSEYTNIAGNFFDTKEIGFINGIVDKLYTTVTKIHPMWEKNK